MAEWTQLLQSIVIGLVFSYLLVKLISIVVFFKDDNLTLSQTDAVPKPPVLDVSAETDSVVADHGSEEEDDDWEGVESTKLDEEFSAAMTFVAVAATDRQKVPTKMH